MAEGKTTGNPLVYTANATGVDTWITNGELLVIAHAVWTGITATGSIINFARHNDSAASSLITSRVGLANTDMVIWPDPIEFTKLFLNDFNSGTLYIYKE